jgi:hypothetical protein
MVKTLQTLVGIESDLPQVVWQLRELVQEIRAPVVGGYQITCSDEAEWECARAFQRSFPDAFLPGLKPDCRAPFRSINLGSRYEPGAIPVAEEHFATPEARDTFKLLVVKINSHVGVRASGDGWEYGWMDRYARPSMCCGALGRLLQGDGFPALKELRETFQSGGKDRIGILRDARMVAPRYRALLAAVANARLQAERAKTEIEQYVPLSPTMYYVLPCVTFNRPGPDTELIVGQYLVNWTGATPTSHYEGLGDDPAAYRVHEELGRVYLEDKHWPED